MSDENRADAVDRFIRATTPYHQRLHRLAVSLCRDPDEAADLTQETLIRAYKSYDQFRTGAKLMPWLARILRNLYLDRFKTSRVKHEVSEQQMGSADAFWSQQSCRDPSPLQELERSHLSELIAYSLNELGEMCKTIVLLCDMEELTYEEASQTLSIPVGTVRSRLARCRARLRQLLVDRVGI